jgi:phenylacetate-CoA ligase
MTRRRLAAYHRLPAPARSAAATAQGARLRWWRYGRSSEALVRAALERDRWEPEQWDRWTAQHLAEVLGRAATSVPAYRERWAALRRAGDTRPADTLASWPVLAKEELRRAPESFLVDPRPRRTYVDRTSGTTGTPITTVASRASLQAWFALHEARTRRWHGVSRHDRWALLGGQPVVAGDRDRPPFWVHNYAGHQLYLSGQHVGPATAPAFADALRAHQPTHLVTYPALGAALASDLLAADIVLDGPPVVITNAEAVTPGQRDLFAAAFGAATFETYGMAEMVGGASGCEAGRLHWWPEAGVLEVLDEAGKPVPPGEVGRLVLTGLVNREQLLVRYDSGDRGRGLDPEPCPCGRHLPVMHPVEGRSQDVLVLPGGRRAFWFNPLFYGLPVREAQVVQTAEARLVVRVVTASGWDGPAAAEVVRRGNERFGRDVVVEVEVVDRLQPDVTGKVRPVVSQREG